MTNYVLTHILIFNFALSFLCIAYADGMNIKFGLWEMKSIVTMPFGGGTQEHISQDCFTKSMSTPEKLMKNNQGCEILDKKVDAKSMQWTVRCQNEGIETISKGSMQSTETTMTGSMNLSTRLNGENMEISTNWEGKFIGDCK